MEKKSIYTKATLVSKGELYPECPENTPPIIVELVSKCCQYNPNDRPSFEEICKYLKDQDQQDDQQQVIDILEQQQRQQQTEKQSNTEYQIADN